MICFLEFFICFIFLQYLTTQVIYSTFPTSQSFSVVIVLYITTRLPGDSDLDLWKMFMEGKSFVQYT